MSELLRQRDERTCEFAWSRVVVIACEQDIIDSCTDLGIIVWKLSAEPLIKVDTYSNTFPNILTLIISDIKLCPRMTRIKRCLPKIVNFFNDGDCHQIFVLMEPTCDLFTKYPIFKLLTFHFNLTKNADSLITDNWSTKIICISKITNQRRTSTEYDFSPFPNV